MCGTFFQHSTSQLHKLHAGSVERWVGRLGKDGSMARKLVLQIGLEWKLQLCFSGGSKAQEK